MNTHAKTFQTVQMGIQWKEPLSYPLARNSTENLSLSGPSSPTDIQAFRSFAPVNNGCSVFSCGV